MGSTKLIFAGGDFGIRHGNGCGMALLGAQQSRGWPVLNRNLQLVRLADMATYLTIAMPLDCYDGFMSKLDPASQAYQIMKDAVIERREFNDHYVGTMRITCPENEIEMLLDHANRLYPGAAPAINKAIDSPGD